MHWRIKAFVQGTLSRVPGGVSVNAALQRSLGARRRPAPHIDSKVQDDWLVHLANLKELGFRPEGRSLVEIGTGWLPVFPICFSLAGAARCRTFDLDRHMARGAMRLALRHLERHLPSIAWAAGQPEPVVRERHQRLAASGTEEELARRGGIEYLAPADATRTGLPAGSVDLVFSNSVLEHVSDEALDPIMRETRRILKPDGIAIHSVNCGDHYAHFDRRLSPIHYLRFSDREWKRWNNDILFQNRLRPRDFLEAARRGGLRIVLDRHRARPELLAQLPALRVDDRFRSYPAEELCCTSIDFAAVPEVVAGGGSTGPAAS